ncbi:coiled-coil domain-containing protein [Hyphococcus lacteus]|uniref:Methyl-accepting transducer domain-containing protein n=1 Tax=Hyphococcus lacteus TaxID=3143536 RepID=A0ABV3Z504_9PROT
MTDQKDENVNDEVKADQNTGNGRMRLKGIIEAEGRETTTEADNDLSYIRHDERQWNAMSRQIWQVSRLTAVFVFFSVVIGLPLGNYFAHLRIEQLSGQEVPWSPLAAFQLETLLFAFIIPALVLFIGYALSRVLTMLNAAESIAAAAQRMTMPDASAVQNVQSVGAVVQTHMSALNEGLDGALSRLASVEAMIRQHVEAISIAGEAIETKATGAVGRVADERSKLMELTESLNAHADSFAAAIAEKASATIESLHSAEATSLQSERDFDDRLTRLEGAAERAFNSFESLRDALRDVDESMRNSAQSIDASAEETRKASERANAAADAAAESAARNAANVASSAQRAGEDARKAADDAIKAARQHAERGTRGAIEAASEESARVQDAASKALEDITRTTAEAIAAAKDGAEKATLAAQEVSEAAQRTGEAANKASSDVAEASERARQSSEDAIKFTESEASRIEERNQALAEARAALEEENERLESLIDEQRKRADRLAEAIASQTDRLSRLAEAQLREQEASARLAEAQNEIQARADRQAAEKKKAQETAQKELDAATIKKAVSESHQTIDLGGVARKKSPPTQPVQAPQRPAARPTQPPQAKPNTGSGAARLEELARDIAERRPAKQAKRKEPPVSTTKTSPPADAKSTKRMKSDVSWKEILDAADDSAPLDLGAAAKKAEHAKSNQDAEDAIRIIATLQDFTYELETRLYGDPPPALQDRFDHGDRNVFANRILRLNEADVKRRIRSESARDRDFENSVHQFLQGFERLLEDATTSETADEELEEYLSSPLGRVYLLIGATVGYFA